jgi:hypothetical protein
MGNSASYLMMGKYSHEMGEVGDPTKKLGKAPEMAYLSDPPMVAANQYAHL